MSAGIELQAAVVAALGAAAGIAGVAAVFDGPPPRAAFPYLVLGDGLSFDWSTKTERGREHQVAVTAWDEGGRTGRLAGLLAAVEDALGALPPALPINRIVSVTLVRSRLLRTPGGPWAGLVEHRVRTLRI